MTKDAQSKTEDAEDKDNHAPSSSGSMFVRSLNRSKYDRFALDGSKLREIAQFCSQIGIGFSSTPYSNVEVDQLAQISNLAFIKVASMDLTNYPFLAHVCQTELPIVLSTGMCSFDEISRSI